MLVVALAACGGDDDASAMTTAGDEGTEDLDVAEESTRGGRDGSTSGQPMSEAATGAGVDSGAEASSSDTGDPAVPDLVAPEFVLAWGQLGTAPGEFVEPSSVELDSFGDVYVAGHEDRLQKFTPQGELLDIFGGPGMGDGQFNHPHGLAMDRSTNTLYAGDQENHRVQVFTHEGGFLRLWDDDQFVHIHDVGIDPLTGDIFVGDFELMVMQRFTAQGDFVLEWGGPGTGDGEFNGVWGISTDSQGRVYVADSANGRVQVFLSDGTYVDKWLGFNKPTGVFVDQWDRIFVCDSLEDEILILDTEGLYLQIWDLTAIVGETSEPEDIVMTPDNVHFYIGDVLHHRVIYLRRPQ